MSRNGLKIRKPKRILRARYTAASGAFEVDLNRFLGEVPDIASLSKPLNVAKVLVEEATDALGKYSRFLGRNPEARNSIEAHALLPECLWPLFPCAEMEDLRRWADRIIESGGLSPVEHVIERLEGVRPEMMGKRQLTGDDWEKVHAVLGGTGDFVEGRPLDTPPSLDDTGESRRRWTVLEEFGETAYERLVAGRSTPASDTGDTG